MPVKPVSQRDVGDRVGARVAGPDQVADDQLVEPALGDQLGEPLGASAGACAHAPSSRFSSSSASR